jgi:peptide chain release factor 1
VFRATGEGARELFDGEAGGHRWQRTPPNEKRGRVHSSTITVAVLAEEVDDAIVIRRDELDWSTCRAPGKGGQHVQKTDSAVQVTHLPTGLQVRSHAQRSQRAHLEDARRAVADAQRARDRRAQIGSGMRGDKRRTVRVQEGVVIDHETGRTWRLRDYLRGAW